VDVEVLGQGGHGVPVCVVRYVEYT
jgi:hypothetical protein